MLYAARDTLFNEVFMTLEELVPAAKELSAADKIKLIRVLVEDLDTSEDTSPFEPGKTYYLATPYEAIGAGQALLEAMKRADSEKQ